MWLMSFLGANRGYGFGEEEAETGASVLLVASHWDTSLCHLGRQYCQVLLQSAGIVLFAHCTLWKEVTLSSHWRNGNPTPAQ